MATRVRTEDILGISKIDRVEGKVMQVTLSTVGASKVKHLSGSFRLAFKRALISAALSRLRISFWLRISVSSHRNL